MRIRELERELHKSIKEAQKNGVTIIERWTGVRKEEGVYNLVVHNGSKECCAMGAYLIGKESKPDIASTISFLGYKLGREHRFISSFMDGFDNNTIPYGEELDRQQMLGYNLGKKFRKRYINNVEE